MNKFLSLIEFTYVDSFHPSIIMTPYEAMYARRNIIAQCWFEIGSSLVLEMDVVQ